jgi:hypothetical protein
LDSLLFDCIANILFSGFVDLTEGYLLLLALVVFSSDTTPHFIIPKNGDLPCLDKYFLKIQFFYNEQPYCELVSAQFFELDLSPCPTELNEIFDTLREKKIVLDLTVKILQVQV